MKQNYPDKLMKIVADAYKKALMIVRTESQPDISCNAEIIAASQITPLLLEIDLDEEEKEPE